MRFAAELERELRILVVDDEQDIADTLAHILRLEGYDVRAFYSAEVALVVACDWIPHLAIIDVHLVQMTGVDFAVLLKQRSPTCEILMFSGRASTSQVLLGAHDEGYTFPLLSKPVHPVKLLEQASLLLKNALGDIDV